MTANKGKVLLQVQGLEKKFDDNQVLDGITTDICQGEVVAVIGPSGSGKSTATVRKSVWYFSSSISFRIRQ